MTADPALAPLVLRARLMARPAAVDSLDALAGPADRALLAWYAWGSCGGAARWREALVACPLPASGLPADPALAGWPETYWDHRLGPAGVRLLLDPAPAAPAISASTPFATARPAATTALAITYGRSPGRTWIRAAADGVAAWIRSWPTPPLLQAPAMAAVRRGDLVLVVEGHETAAFDAATGRLLRRAALDSEPMPDLLRLVTDPRGPRLLMLAPPGMIDRLVDEDGRIEMLPAPARWCEAMPGGGLVMADRQGRGWRRGIEGGWTACPLPAALVGAIPEPRCDGLEADGRLHPWSKSVP